MIARTAKSLGCQSVAFTYNDPIIFLEYAIDTAIACRELGLQTVAVTAGYMCEKPRELFFKHMDAANIDLKAFSESFYRKHCKAKLAPILDTISYVHHHTDTWLELTTLLIPEENDSDHEIEAMAQWVMKNLGPNVPIHFSAFHPDYRLTYRPSTPVETLCRARKIALAAGLNYVYTGNVHNSEGDTTYCPGCKSPLIVRDWYDIKEYELSPSGSCSHCGEKIAGVFIGGAGNWGRKRLPVSPAMIAGDNIVH
jgi:pyruvate formate lyase activating enzyme